MKNVQKVYRYRRCTVLLFSALHVTINNIIGGGGHCAPAEAMRCLRCMASVGAQ